MIDLRSDTVTKPSNFMKEYMMDAALGDDVFQDDPTVKELVDSLKKEFISSINEQKDLLDTYK